MDQRRAGASAWSSIPTGVSAADRDLPEAIRAQLREVFAHA